MPLSPMTRWLTVAEAADYIRARDEKTLRNAITAGDLPAYTYGKGQIRLKADEIDAWLEGRPFEPKSAAS